MTYYVEITTNPVPGRLTANFGSYLSIYDVIGFRIGGTPMLSAYGQGLSRDCYSCI